MLSKVVMLFFSIKLSTGIHLYVSCMLTALLCVLYVMACEDVQFTKCMFYDTNSAEKTAF